MKPRPYISSILWGTAALAAVAFGLGYAGFAGRIAATACGPIEYADMGEGPALLLVHGASS
jgi:hypothetical protein